MLDHEDGHAFPLEPPQQRHHALRLDGAEAGHQLVEQQEVRLGRERARQLQALAIHQRERRGWHVPTATEADEREQPFGLGGGRRAALPRAAVEAADQHVLERGEPGERPDVLKRARDALGADAVGRPARDVAAGHTDAAGVRTERAGDQVEESGLP